MISHEVKNNEKVEGYCRNHLADLTSQGMELGLRPEPCPTDLPLLDKEK